MKEQLTRSLIYRGYINSTGNIEVRPQDFVWISILDGDWGVTRSNPLKYMHGLQWGGYQYMLAADSLVDNNYELLPIDNNPLISVLEDLDCYTSQDEFNKVWTRWLAERVRGISDQPEQLLPAIMEPIYDAEQQSFDWDDIASDDGDL